MNLHRLKKMIFSREIKGKHKVLRILGLKLTLRNWNHYDRILTDCAERLVCLEHPRQKGLGARFVFDVRPNSVLVVEPNEAHGEVAAGYVSYLLDLGYNVDVVLRPEIYRMGPLCRLKDERVRSAMLPLTSIKRFLESEEVAAYKRIFFTSHFIYQWLDSGAPSTVFNHFPGLEKHLDKVAATEHHFERINPELLRRDRVVTLADFGGGDGRSISAAPLTVGSVEITPKNTVSPVNFIVVGEISAEHRSYGLLFDAAEALRREGTGGFKITLIGRGRLDAIPEAIQPYFDIKGHVDSSALYKAMEDADFFLLLLDPRNRRHRRYLTVTTSGNFHLIHAFRKPCLIQEAFAAKYGFNQENSLVYSGGGDFAEAMARAVKMSAADYAAMQAGLEKRTQDLRAGSLETLKRVMGGEETPCPKTP